MASRPKDDTPGRQRKRAKRRPAEREGGQPPEPHAEAETPAEREARAILQRGKLDWRPFKAWCDSERRPANRAQAILWSHYQDLAWEREQPHEKAFNQLYEDVKFILEDIAERRAAFAALASTEVVPTPATSPEPEPLHWQNAVHKELNHRAQNGRLEQGVVEQARVLHAWLIEQGIKAPRTAKAVEQCIRESFKELSGGSSARRGPKPH